MSPARRRFLHHHPGRRPIRPRLGTVLLRALRRITEATACHGNHARLLIDGPAAFQVMLDRIATATRRVHLENYMFHGDATGQHFAAALAERARSGVDVRVIYDWFGSLHTPGSFWKELRRAGCEVRAFGPPSPRRPLAFLRRDHRKLLVTDNSYAVVGGLCIGDEWAGNESTAPWRDTAIGLAGPIVRELDDSFATIWRNVGGSAYMTLDDADFPDADLPSDLQGNVTARVIDGPPVHARAYRIYQLITTLAERSLYITGAYPLFPTPLLSALAAAARAGVDVRLLAPGRSDLALLNEAARAHYTRLLTAGVRIYEWKGAMLHAKTVTTDSKLAIIGSSNLNPYSFLSTYELDVIVEDRGIASELESKFLDDLQHAREIRLEEWRDRPASQRWRERLGTAVHWLPYRIFY